MYKVLPRSFPERGVWGTIKEYDTASSTADVVVTNSESLLRLAFSPDTLQGVVKLADFGVATKLGELEEHGDELQQHVVGTPYWMAPEVSGERWVRAASACP